MTEQEFRAILNTDYTFTFKGSTMAYILNLLSAEQRRLDKAVENNITDINATMTAGANTIVGTDVLVAMFNAMGGKILEEAFGAKPEALKEAVKSMSVPKKTSLH